MSEGWIEIPRTWTAKRIQLAQHEFFEASKPIIAELCFLETFRPIVYIKHQDGTLEHVKSELPPIAKEVWDGYQKMFNDLRTSIFGKENPAGKKSS